MTDVKTGDLDAFRKAFAGRVVTPQDSDYDSIRAQCVWNASINRRPALIARAASPQDVATAISFARASGREVSVRGGGHNFSGLCIADDAVMIDLGALNKVEVDVAARVARVGGGARWAEVDAAAQAHGLATPGGFISHTGVAGLTLGGGIGWLSRVAGLSCDNLVSAEMVSADGEILHVSADEHPDLFWALRGGGGNFGVVTTFELALHQVGPMVHLSLSFWDLEHGPGAFRAFRDQASSLARDEAAFLATLNAPPAPFVPEAYVGAPGYVVILVGHGEPASHEAAVAALRSVAPPQFHFDTPLPFTALQQMFDEGAPWGIHGYEKALSFDDLTDEAIDVVARHVPLKSSPMSFTPIFLLGGAVGDVDDDATAFGGRRSTRYVFNIAAVAPDAATLETDRAWVRAFWADLEPHSQGIGSYVNFMSEDEPDRVRAAYGDAKYERLAEVKARYDPNNVFHLNMNIAPAR
jgi:FAD/FMN-containing dehydrogenase